MIRAQLRRPQRPLEGTAANTSILKHTLQFRPFRCGELAFGPDEPRPVAVLVFVGLVRMRLSPFGGLRQHISLAPFVMLSMVHSLAIPTIGAQAIALAGMPVEVCARFRLMTGSAELEGWSWNIRMALGCNRS